MPQQVRPRTPLIAAVLALAVALALPGASAVASSGMQARVVLPPGNSQFFSLDAFLLNGPQELAGTPPDADA